MKHHLLIYILLCLLVFLSCSNREQDDMIIGDVIVRDTIVVDKKDTIIIEKKDTIIIDKKDTVIVEKDTVIVEKKDTIFVDNGFTVLNEDETIDFNVEKVVYWTKQIRGKKGKQGGDAYNGLFCQFESGHSILDIIDITNRQPITTIEPDYNENYHCNNADFSNTFLDINDEFPLLYSSQQSKNARCVIADRITLRNGNYILETVQRIDLPYDKEKPLQYSPDAVIDKENGFLYVYSGMTTPITDFYIYKFRLPRIEEGEVVQLKEKDIISKWIIEDNPAYYKQGGKIIGGFLITLEGKSDNKMRIIDLENHRYKLIDIMSIFGAKWEPEDIFEVDGEIFVASGATGIYKFVLSDNR